MKSLQERFSQTKEKLPVIVAGSALATGALFMTGCSTNAEAPAYAYCTGSQEVTAQEGQTLQGMIEAHVAMPPDDRLMSATENGGSGLDILAQGITTKYDGKSATVPLNYGEAMQVGVQAEESYLLPEECHAPDDK